MQFVMFVLREPPHSKALEKLPFHDTQINFHTHHEASIVSIHLHPTLHVTQPSSVIREMIEHTSIAISAKNSSAGSA